MAAVAVAIDQVDVTVHEAFDLALPRLRVLARIAVLVEQGEQLRQTRCAEAEVEFHLGDALRRIEFGERADARQRHVQGARDQRGDLRLRGRGLRQAAALERLLDRFDGLRRCDRPALPLGEIRGFQRVVDRVAEIRAAQDRAVALNRRGDRFVVGTACRQGFAVPRAQAGETVLAAAHAQAPVGNARGRQGFDFLPRLQRRRRGHGVGNIADHELALRRRGQGRDALAHSGWLQRIALAPRLVAGMQQPLQGGVVGIEGMAPDHMQRVPGAGQADVEQAQVFGALGFLVAGQPVVVAGAAQHDLALLAAAPGLVGVLRRPALRILRLHELDPAAAATAAGKRSERQEHDRVFQALALVQRGHLHRVRVRIQPQRHVLVRRWIVAMPREPAQQSMHAMLHGRFGLQQFGQVQCVGEQARAAVFAQARFRGAGEERQQRRQRSTLLP